MPATSSHATAVRPPKPSWRRRRARSAVASRCSSARRPASARRTPCSRPRGSDCATASTWWSAWSRRTDAPRPRRLLDGLEVVPRQTVEYRGRSLTEMDLDAILERRPELVLVDELAHTNAPGSRHPKRWLDVEELLDAGIDVYTTVNIQHLESLNDVVAQITGVRVRETIPDRVLDRADEVKLIDLSPEELIQRLQEGKVYVPEAAERALRNYFHPANLTALRELALRETAEHVDEQMQAHRRARADPDTWAVSERVLVAISGSELSERLVRAARRMAERRGAPWLAVFVEPPRFDDRPEAERERVHRALRLAEQLGGEAVTIPGRSVAEDLLALRPRAQCERDHPRQVAQVALAGAVGRLRGGPGDPGERGDRRPRGVCRSARHGRDADVVDGFDGAPTDAGPPPAAPRRVRLCDRGHRGRRRDRRRADGAPAARRSQHGLPGRRAAERAGGWARAVHPCIGAPPFVFPRLLPVCRILWSRSHYNNFAVLVDFNTSDSNASFDRGLECLGHVALFECLLATRHC